MFVITTSHYSAIIVLWTLRMLVPFNTAASVFSINCNYSVEYKLRNQYGDEYCRSCSTCRPGTGMLKPCSKDHNIVCSKCTNGTFSHGGHRPCKPCRRCDGNFHVARACAPHRNSHCKMCKPGKYFEPERHKCKKCRMCPPGTYVKRKCSPLQNTECATCPFGTYSNEYNSFPFCKVCTRCQPLEEISRFCNTTHNSACGDCRTGFFRLESTLSCAQCSYCYPDNPGYTFQIPECVRTVNDSRYTCMPMLRPPFPIQSNVKSKIHSSTDSIRIGKIKEAVEDITKTEEMEDEERKTVYMITILGSALLILFVSLCVVFLCFTSFIQRACCVKDVRKRCWSLDAFTGNKLLSMVSQSCSDSVLYIRSGSYDDCSKIATVQKISKSLQGSSCLLHTEDFDNFLNENSKMHRYPKPRSFQACGGSSTKKCKDYNIDGQTSCSNNGKTNFDTDCLSDSSTDVCADFSTDSNMNSTNDELTHLNKVGCKKGRQKRHLDLGNYVHNTTGCMNSSSNESFILGAETNTVTTICYPNIGGCDTGEAKEESQDIRRAETSVKNSRTESGIVHCVDYSTFPITKPKFKFHVDNDLKRMGYYSQ